MAKNGNDAKGVMKGGPKEPGISPTGPADEQKNVLAQLLGIDLDGGADPESMGEGLPTDGPHPDAEQDLEQMALLQKLGLA